MFHLSNNYVEKLQLSIYVCNKNQSQDINDNICDKNHKKCQQSHQNGIQKCCLASLDHLCKI